MDPIKFSVEPFEDNKVVYQRVAPPVKDGAITGMLYFYLDINNDGSPVTLTKIDVSFPGSTEPPVSYGRNQVIGTSRREWLKDEEAVKLTKSPTQIKISLTFAGMNSPVWEQWDLGPHQVSYQFFARPENIDEFGEYISLKRDHAGDGGSQHFAQDAGALGWRNGKLSGSKTGLPENTDTFVFGRPIYAMGEGLVLAAEDSNEDNPAPKKRAVNRQLGTFEGKEQVNDLAVACFRRKLDENVISNRILIASATAQGTLLLTALEQTDLADSIAFLKEVTGPSAEKVAIISLNDRYAVTATLVSTTVRITLWELTKDASIVERDHFELFNASAVKLLRLADARLVTAVRAINGKLSLSVWDRDGNKLKTGPLAGNTAGPLGEFDLVALSPSRFVTAVQKQDGELRVIVWDLNVVGQGGGTDGSSFDIFDLVRAGEGDEEGSVSEIAAASLPDPGLFATAMRQTNGTMKLIVWQTSGGDVTRKQAFENESPSSLIQSLFFKTESLAVLSRTGAGRMHLTAIDVELSETSGNVAINILYDTETNGTTDLFCAARLATPQPTLVTVVRANKGVAKVILWQYSYSNFIKILYGNEIVSYLHLMSGSIDDKLIPKDEPVPVTAEDMIGRMGHSGKASGPHLHIQADRVKPEFLNDLQSLMKLVKDDEDVSVFRPLQFHGAKTMRNSEVKPGGADANPLSEMNGHGVYFDDYVVLPDPL